MAATPNLLHSEDVSNASLEGYQLKITFNFSQSSSSEERSRLKSDFQDWLQNEVLTNGDSLNSEQISCKEGSTIVAICFFVAKGVAGGVLAAMGGLFFRFLRGKLKNSFKSGEDIHEEKIIQANQIRKVFAEQEKEYKQDYGIQEILEPSLQLPRRLIESKDIKIMFEVEENYPDRAITKKWEAQYVNGELKSTIHSTSTEMR